jgi:hypothetical protein
MLTKEQKQAAEALFKGHSVEDVAREINFPVRRVRRWLGREEFQQEMDQLSEESMRETRAILTRFGPHAAMKLVELLGSEKADTARRAALDLVDRCLNRKAIPPEDGEDEDISDEQAQEMLKTLAEGLTGRNKVETENAVK